MHSMDVSKTILSVGRLNDTGHTVIFSPQYARILREGRSLELQRKNGVSYLHGHVVEEEDSHAVLGRARRGYYAAGFGGA